MCLKQKWINRIKNISDSLSLSLFLSFATCLSGFTTARILLKERARSDDDDDLAFDRENRGGCL